MNTPERYKFPTTPFPKEYSEWNSVPSREIKTAQISSEILGTVIDRIDEMYGDTEPQFRNVYVVAYPDGSSTYVLEYSNEDNEADTAYFVDAINHKAAGMTNVVLSNIQDYRNDDPDTFVPHVGSSDTFDTFEMEGKIVNLQGSGLGERRYRLMNSYCLARYRIQLYSGWANDLAGKLWNKLIAAGVAELNPDYVEGQDNGRFRFKHDAV